MNLRSFFLIVSLIIVTPGISQNIYQSNDFNKWSVEGAVGFTKPYRSFSPGYWTPKVGFLATDIGVRYMFNEYFGLKYGLGYNYYHSAKNSKEFDTDQLIMSLQAVINAGRLLKIESLSSRLNILAHAGFGKGNLKYDRPNITRNDVDHVFNILGGITGQYKISKRFALNTDITGLLNLSQDHSNFDGGVQNDFEAGIVFNGTVGVSYYFGKKKKHADWYLRDEENYNQIYSDVDQINSRIEKSDNDVEQLDDELEGLKSQVKMLESQLLKKEDVVNVADNNSTDLIFDTLTKNGYCDIFFDFNSFKLKGASLKTINFLVNYMKDKPSIRLKLTGFSDDQGDEKYNLRLSERRAEEVKKYLIELGINSERIVTEGKGIDVNSKVESGISRQFARRVSVELF